MEQFPRFITINKEAGSYFELASLLFSDLKIIFYSLNRILFRQSFTLLLYNSKGSENTIKSRAFAVLGQTFCLTTEEFRCELDNRKGCLIFSG